jgi:hypothetical protein
MRINLSCPKCIKEGLYFNSPEHWYFFEVSESWEYEINCINGHKTKTIMEQHKFEILFEMGVQALIDGYTREAISSIATSIERFHEFSIEVFINKNQIEFSEFEKTWKEMGKQSERQLGSYYMLYLLSFNRAPIPINNKLIEFRNNVIHKGIIPSYDQSLRYAKEVFEYIKIKLLELQKNFKYNIESVLYKKVKPEHDLIHIVDTMFRVDKDISVTESRHFDDLFEKRKVRRTFYKNN